MRGEFLFSLIVLLAIVVAALYAVAFVVNSIKSCTFATRMGVCSCNIEDAILQQLQQANANQQQTQTPAQTQK